ncbi:uncharacterized protein LOC116303964 [Actinia tenebrosa]|uniref:Uncharacterized protein LOC116303964 n=1 Tax=Actinia tenebrosa TaxID=6105 RepID=A0A6P8IRH3_ACTTE|nr:uncharacterized protein LOC116303964 [Actinia tenebrosa]
MTPLFWLLSVFLAVQTTSSDVFQNFKTDWCRQRKLRVDWTNLLNPCLKDFNSGSNSYRQSIDGLKTIVENSKINKLEVRPAGEFSRFFIQTYTSKNQKKTIGGDAWRIMLIGPSTLSATVFDHNDGTYEALFLVLEPGKYHVVATLDYTLCDGLRDPPIEWFQNTHCSGKHRNSSLDSEVFAELKTYINKPIKTKEGLFPEFDVPWERWNKVEQQNNMRLANRLCDIKCTVMWDGYGRWVGKNWLPYMNITLQDYPKQSPLSKGTSRHAVGKGTFWIYGDSLSYYFYEALISDPKRTLCSKVFKSCSVSYNWIYPKTLYEVKETCDEMVLNVTKVMVFFKNVLNEPTMDADSAFLFNAGAHYVKTTSFKTYKTVIQEFVKEIKNSYPGKPVWKTTTAIHQQSGDIMGAFRRYTTKHRIKLYNAYANSVMCANGIPILDVFHLSSSYPEGTLDGIHYDSVVFTSVYELLESYFSS